MRQRKRQALAVLGAAAVAMVISAGWAVQRPASPQTYAATVTVDASGRTTGQLGNQFIGLSFESETLNSGAFDDTGNLAQLLKNLGSSIMRFGGNSVDTSFTGITPSALSGLVRLADASGWSVLYSEDLAHYNGAQVSADASAVSSALGSKLFAFACGNEPDIYTNNGNRPDGYTVQDYLSQVSTCLQTIHAAAPDAALEGPDTSGSRTYFADFAAQEGPVVSWLGQHYYPLGCANHATGSDASLVGELLSPGLAAKEARTLSWYAGAAKKAGDPLVITETNSACGGGIPGVSDSYASALWVIDYLLTGAKHGVHAMDFHGGTDSYCVGYTVLCGNGSPNYNPQPIYYGMLFTHLLGSGKFLPVKVSRGKGGQGNMTAFALKSAHGLRLMLENLSAEQANTTIRFRGADPTSASMLTLTGPDPLATWGVQIQGASVAWNGTIAPGQPDALRCPSPGECTLTLAPYSAAVVTVG